VISARRAAASCSPSTGAKALRPCRCFNILAGWGPPLSRRFLRLTGAFPTRIALAPRSDVPFDQRINIRIHTDHKWPERVVFDTTRSTLAQSGDAQTDVGGREAAVPAERQPFDAFAEMTALSARPSLRPPPSARLAAAREVSSIKNGASIQDPSRPSIVERKSLTSPNRPHKPQGKS
jgi:hypothetical protein